MGQTPAGQPPVLRLREQALYGSARLGLRQANLPLVPGQALPAATSYYARVLSQKRYELTDYLGNVRAVVTDQKASTLSASTGQPLLSSITPVLDAYYNYYPFGQLQPGRYGPKDPTANGGYRFGYNGKEKDNNGELGSLTTYDYGFRIYNPGLGRFLSVDPLMHSYPFYTPYQFAGNTPIAAIDVDGAEEKVVTHMTGKSVASTVAIATARTVAKDAAAEKFLAEVLKVMGEGAKKGGKIGVGAIATFLSGATQIVAAYSYLRS